MCDQGTHEMMFIRIVAVVLSMCAIATGLLFLAQGTGVLMWPRDSFILEDRGWAVRGAVLAAVGGIVIWLARRN